MKVAELAKPRIPQSFAQMKLRLAEQDVQKAQEALTKCEEEVQYWQGLLEHKYEDE